MNPVGGYFGLELAKGGYTYHTTPFTFKNGRSSLHQVLRLVKPSLVYIPYYTCNGLLESFEAGDTKYRFYSINQQLEPNDLPYLEDGEYFLYINYFDVKRAFVNKLSEKYRDKLIVDCTQAFFMKGNGKSWFFNSCRKFFGVPDGSFLYPPEGITIPAPNNKNERYTIEHLLLRFNGHTEEGYQAFVANEMLLGAEIAGMSELSACLLSNINYAEVIIKRITNFKYLDKLFGAFHISPPETGDQGVPMVYPALLNKPIDRKLLNSHRIFIPAFWTDVLNRDGQDAYVERHITTHLLPLPLDHRYNQKDMERMITLIKPLL
jgi:hypothetical protein